MEGVTAEVLDKEGATAEILDKEEATTRVLDKERAPTDVLNREGATTKVIDMKGMLKDVSGTKNEDVDSMRLTEIVCIRSTNIDITHWLFLSCSLTIPDIVP